jgi:hypothetical protein
VERELLNGCVSMEGSGRRAVQERYKDARFFGENADGLERPEADKAEELVDRGIGG